MVTTEQLRFPLDIQFFGEEDEDPNIDPAEVKDEELDEGEEEGQKGEEKDNKPAKQSQSQNAKYAQMRREAEAKAKAEKEEAYRKGLIDGVKVNPFTKEPIEDDYDLEIYQIQEELNQQGKDPVAELPRELAKRKRDKANSEKEKAAQEIAEKQAQDKRYAESMEAKRKEIEQVREKYGLSKDEIGLLLTEGEFAEKVKEKENRWTLDEIFEAFYRPISQDKRRTPNVTPGGSKVEKSIMDMSDDEFLAWKKSKRG